LKSGPDTYITVLQIVIKPSNQYRFSALFVVLSVPAREQTVVNYNMLLLLRIYKKTKSYKSRISINYKAHSVIPRDSTMARIYDLYENTITLLNAILYCIYTYNSYVYVHIYYSYRCDSLKRAATVRHHVHRQ